MVRVLAGLRCFFFFFFFFFFVRSSCQFFYQRVFVSCSVLIDSGNPGHLVVEKELTAWWKAKICTCSFCRGFVARWLGHVTSICKTLVRIPAALRCVFRLIQLSIFLSLSEKKKRVFRLHYFYVKVSERLWPSEKKRQRCFDSSGRKHATTLSCLY